MLFSASTPVVKRQPLLHKNMEPKIDWHDSVGLTENDNIQGFRDLKETIWLLMHLNTAMYCSNF